MTRKATQNGAKKVSKSLLEAILQKNHENSIWAAIYCSLGMSAHPQNHQNFSLWGKKIDTKCITKASLQKSHKKVANVSKNGLKKSEFFANPRPWESLLESSCSLLGLRSDSGVLLRGLQNDPKVLQN